MSLKVRYGHAYIRGLIPNQQIWKDNGSVESYLGAGAMQEFYQL